VSDDCRPPDVQSLSVQCSHWHKCRYSPTRRQRRPYLDAAHYLSRRLPHCTHTYVLATDALLVCSPSSSLTSSIPSSSNTPFHSSSIIQGTTPRSSSDPKSSKTPSWGSRTSFQPSEIYIPSGTYTANSSHFAHTRPSHRRSGHRPHRSLYHGSISAAHGSINEPLAISERNGCNNRYNPQLGQLEKINEARIWIMKDTGTWTTLSKR